MGTDRRLQIAGEDLHPWQEGRERIDIRWVILLEEAELKRSILQLSGVPFAAGVEDVL
jgi:hypothetical protein